MLDMPRILRALQFRGWEFVGGATDLGAWKGFRFAGMVAVTVDQQDAGPLALYSFSAKVLISASFASDLFSSPVAVQTPISWSPV